MDREQIESMTREERKALVRKIHIPHPRFNHLWNLIKRRHHQPKSDGPANMLVYGPPGVGKTWLRKRYVEMNMVVSWEETPQSRFRKQNILACDIHSSAHPTRVTERMLQSLGDPHPTKGSPTEKESRVTSYLETQGIELIIFDEVQHLLTERQGGYHLEKITDWIKSRSNENSIPIVLFGGEESIQILTKHNQLESRYKTRFKLEKFGLDDEQSFEEFSRLLKEIDRQLPFIEPCGMGDLDMVERLFYTCSGEMRSLMFLVWDAADLAIDRGARKIEREDWSMAWSFTRGDKQDPFLPRKGAFKLPEKGA